MNILIDHQYKTLYNGEFKKQVEEVIIKPLQLVYDITISNSIEESQKLLSSKSYNFVIITGYNSDILALIDIKADTKVISLIYDMNAEYILSEMGENEFLEDIVMHKSRLIFLSTGLVCLNNIIPTQILELYSSYKKLGVNIEDKLFDIDFDYNINDSPIQNKQLSGKYIVIKESLNGLTFASQDFDNIFSQLISNELPNMTVAILSNIFPEKLRYIIKNNNLQSKIKIYKDVTDEELRSLYKYSLFNIFISRFDNDLYNLSNAITSGGICLINDKNPVISSFLEENGNYYSEDDKIVDIILDTMRSNKNILDKIKDDQKTRLIEVINNKKKTINQVIAKMQIK